VKLVEQQDETAKIQVHHIRALKDEISGRKKAELGEMMAARQ